MADEWQNQKFRQNIVAKINDMLQSTGTDSSKNAGGMENHIYKKARSKDEYLGLVAKLFMHFKELANRGPAGKLQQAPNPDMGNANVAQDPLNALQTLASQGNRNAQMMPMGSGQPNQMAPGAGVGVNVAASNLLQTLNQQRPGQQMQNMQGIRGQMNVPMGPNVSQGNVGPGNMVPQMGNSMGNVNANLNMNVMGNQPQQMPNQMGMPGQMNQMGGNQMQINPNMQGQPMNSMNVPQMPMNAMNQNQLNIGLNHPQLNQMMNRMNNNAPMNVGPQTVNQGMHSQMNAAQTMPNMPQQGQMHPSNVNAGPQVGMPQNTGQGGKSRSTHPGNTTKQQPLVGNINQIINMPNMQQKPGMPINQNGGMFAVNRNVGQTQFLRPSPTPSPSPSLPSPAGMGQQIPPQEQQRLTQQQQQQLTQQQQQQLQQHQQQQAQAAAAQQQQQQQQVQQQQQQQQQQQVQQQQQAQQQQQVQQQQQPQQAQLPNPQMIPSPALVPSSSPQMSNLMNNNQRALRQSPNAPLNTPGQVSTNSPFNPQEDILYREKYKQLTKYIEPLKRMVAKIGNDEVEKITKMSKLLEILCNPAQRVPLETLMKCEIALEKMDIVSYCGTQFGKSPNPLVDAISTTLQSPIANHTLQRTFKPSLELLFGTDIRPPAAKQQRLQVDDQPQEIPHVLQGEIARLDQKFKVSLDPSAQNNNKTIKLICCLDDKRLPCVPPVSVSIPEEYPFTSPSCSLTDHEYSSTPFLLAVQKALTARIAKLPKCYSLSHLLDTWEMSVRQACSPNAVVTNDLCSIFGM